MHKLPTEPVNIGGTIVYLTTRHYLGLAARTQDVSVPRKVLNDARKVSKVDARNIEDRTIHSLHLEY